MRFTEIDVFGVYVATVPSPLSVNRWACATPADSNVAHTAATVRLVFRMMLPFFWTHSMRGC